MHLILRYTLFTCIVLFGMQVYVPAGSFTVVPALYAEAETTNTTAGGGGTTNTTPGVGGTTNTTPGIGSNQTPPSSGISIPLQNPLGNVTIQQFFLKIIDIILIFAMPLIVLFIILAGFKYVTAQGNTEQIKSATTALTWAIIGGVLILGAKVILTIIEGTIQAIR